jgi:hypothetical protein
MPNAYVDVVLDSSTLDIFAAAPATLDVNVDFGATGQRGSFWWTGTLAPATALAAQDVKINDIYLNTVTGVLFQYVLSIGVPSWEEIGSITLPQYSTIASATFTTGSATLSIPLASLTSDPSPTASQFVVRFNISNSTTPVASSFTTAIVSTNLNITITAAQWSGGTWSNLTGSKDVHLFISYTG